MISEELNDLHEEQLKELLLKVVLAHPETKQTIARELKKDIQKEKWLELHNWMETE